MSCNNCKNSTSLYCSLCYPSYFASLGGKSKSPKKVKASRLNGRKGGRPKVL